VETLTYTKTRVNDGDITIMLDSSVMTTFIGDVAWVVAEQ